MDNNPVRTVYEALLAHADEEYGERPTGLKKARKALFMVREGHGPGERCALRKKAQRARKPV